MPKDIVRILGTTRRTKQDKCKHSAIGREARNHNQPNLIRVVRGKAHDGPSHMGPNILTVPRL